MISMNNKRPKSAPGISPLYFANAASTYQQTNHTILGVSFYDTIYMKTH